MLYSLSMNSNFKHLVSESELRVDNQILKFRLRTLYLTSVEDLMQDLEQNKDLLCELYNYLWSIYDIKSNILQDSLVIISNYILNILTRFQNSLHDIYSLQLQKRVYLEPRLLSADKPIYDHTSKVDSIFRVILTLICNQINLPINYKSPVNIWYNGNCFEFFGMLKKTMQIKMMVLSDQLGLYKVNPDHVLMVASEFSICKLLRLVMEMSDVDFLFSKYVPLVSKSRDVFSLLPVFQCDRNYKQKTYFIAYDSKKNDQKLDIEKQVYKRSETFTRNFRGVFKEANLFSEQFRDTLTRFLFLLVLLGKKSQASPHQDCVNQILFEYLREFHGFYNQTKLEIISGSLHNFLALSCIHELNKDWIRVIKAQLMSESFDPSSLLLSHLQRDISEQKKAIMIYSTYKWAEVHNFDIESLYRSCIKQSIDPKLGMLIKAVFYNYKFSE
jgi:hypothetical protein